MRLIETGTGATEFIILLLVFYFLPSIIAWLHRRERLNSIFLLNLLAGWTIFGWIGALKLATIRDTRPLEDIAPIPRYGAQKALAIGVSIVAIGLMLQAVRVYVLDSRYAAANPTPVAHPAIDPATVQITRYDVRKDNSGAKGDFTIRNSNNFSVKDVTVKCVNATFDGVVIDISIRTINKIIEPNRELRITEFDMGSISPRTANSSCTAIEFAFSD